MKPLRLCFLLLAFILCQATLSAQTTIAGKVVDDAGEGLIGANIIVKGTTIGATSDLDGSFSFETDTPLPFTVEISYTGFTDQSIEISSSTRDLNIILESGIQLDDVVISASRKREKIQEAPASVSVLGARQLAVSPDVDPTRTLGNMPGVTIQQQSAGRINIEIRGDNGNFGTSAFPILDYRNLIGAGTGTFNSGGAGISTIDLERIEVVRGPGSALYGAGVTSGVIHYISKNPIDNPGTAVELVGGELNTFGITARHATKISDKFGFKINAQYRRGDEFGLDPNDPTDAASIAALSNTISTPTIINGRSDPHSPGTVLIDNLDTDGDGNPMEPDYFNFSVNATLEFRPSDDLSVNLSGGRNDNKSLFWNNQGEGITTSTEYWTQARAQYKGLFAQIFYSTNDGGFGHDIPTALYRTGLVSAVERKALETQIQYNFEIPTANLDITTGFDTRQAFSDTRSGAYGRNDDVADYTVYGGYLQAKWALAPKLDVLVAGRYDGFNFVDDGFFSPRAALVFKPSDNHTFRASYNVAGNVPSALALYLDLPVSVVVPGLLDIWAAGGNNIHTYDENSVIDVTIPGFPSLPINATGMPLAFPYLAVNGPVLEALTPALGDDPLGIIPFLQGFVPTGTTGTLYGWNLFNGPESPLGIQDNAPLTVSKETTYEFGYSGFIKDKLKLTLDIYNRRIDGARNFTALAPVYSLLGADSGTGLATEVGAALTNHLTGLGLDQATAEATAAGIAAAYQGAGTAFDDPATGAGALYSIFGAAESGVGAVPLDDNVVHIASGNRVNDLEISYVGIDFGAQYYLTNDLIGYFNYSWLSQNEWTPERDGVTSTFNLNTPDNKFRLGLNYVPTEGFSGSIGFQHTPSYNATFGLYSGATDEQNLVDLSLGYAFGNGLKLGFNVNNLFNSEYRFSPAMPKIGRMALAKVTYAFGQNN